MKKIVYISIFILSVSSVVAQTWNVGGNSGLSSPANFLGTTDNVPIVFKVKDSIAGYTGRTGDNNVSWGYQAMIAPNANTGNTALGIQALSDVTSGSNNVAIGYKSFVTNKTGSNNVAIGAFSMSQAASNTSNNIAIGIRSLLKNQASDNIAIGKDAAFNNISGNQLIAIGDSTLVNNIYGSNNIAIGRFSMLKNTAGNNNIAFGYETLKDNINGEYNVAAGYRSMLSNISGSNNAALGVDALANNMSGNENVAVGVRALYNSIGNFNTAVGWEAMMRLTSGQYNAAMGYSSLSNATTGDGNVAFGNEALKAIVSGKNNTALGNSADTRSSEAVNTIAIGYNTVATKNNSAVIGNKKMKNIGGYSDWALYPKNVSDVEVSQGLDFILALKPIEYTVGEDEQVHTGLDMNSVEDAARIYYADASNFSGIDYNEETNSMEGLRYMEFIAPLVQAIKDLKTRIDVLEHGTSDASTTLSGCKMELKQNQPNPFKTETSIEYSLPQPYRNAYITIVASGGQHVRKIELNSQSGQVTVNNKGLTPGVYIYSLVIDEKIVASNKMVLSK